MRVVARLNTGDAPAGSPGDSESNSRAAAAVAFIDSDARAGVGGAIQLFNSGLFELRMSTSRTTISESDLREQNPHETSRYR